MCVKTVILISLDIVNWNGVFKAKDKIKSNMSIFSYTFSSSFLSLVEGYLFLSVSPKCKTVKQDS